METRHPVRKWQELRQLSDAQLYALIRGAVEKGQKQPSDGHLRNVLGGHAAPSVRLIELMARACGIPAGIIVNWHCGADREAKGAA